MARSTSWGYTNTTASLATASLVTLGEYSNYGVLQDAPEACRLTNKTSPLDQPEKVTFRCASQDISLQGLAYPGPSKGGVLYSCRVDDVLRVTDPASTGSATVVDEPISMWLTVKHSTSNSWSNTDIATVLGRLLGALYDETNSKWRFEDLMRSALRPKND